ncbi:MAG: pseudouridine synthase [Alphaproteobacteria bacterium]|mgnify:CR=1 FL=1|jgi:23S rRNA pseudouridine2605 synthase|tara:strand:- start:6003 stop:6680 length:678 start_codon:yes stop_codon:yes gene_type:complete
MPHITLSKKVSEEFKISRKRAEEIIKEGQIFINEIEEKRPFIKVLETQFISVKKDISKSKIKLLIFNKPKGCITTQNDEKERKTIYYYLPKKFHEFHYIGRLDYNTEGLLILTNNKKYKRELENPQNNITRRYVVKVVGNIDAKKINSMNQKIYGELVYKKPNIKLLSQNKNTNTLIFELHEGKNREIRKICEIFNLRVDSLKRINFGQYHLKGIPIGGYKEIII